MYPNILATRLPHPLPTTGMHPSKVIDFTILPRLNLLSLVLLHLLSSALPLPLEPVILILDLDLASFGFPSAASPIPESISTTDTHQRHILDRQDVENGDTHVNSTLILLAGDFPSSNDEW